MSTRTPVRSVLRSPARLAARATAFALCAGLASAQIKLGMVQGDGSGDHLGTDVAAVGDVDGDGKTDYVVGAPYPFSGSHARYARVHSGASGATLFTFSSTVAVNHNVVPWFYLLNPGETWNFQLWYRDTAAGGAGFNLSDGLRVTFLP